MRVIDTRTAIADNEPQTESEDYTLKPIGNQTLKEGSTKLAQMLVNDNKKLADDLDVLNNKSLGLNKYN